MMGPGPRFNTAAGCQGKRPYSSRGEVRRALTSMRRNHQSSGSCDFYRCPGCGAFHIGKSRRVKQALPVRAFHFLEEPDDDERIVS